MVPASKRFTIHRSSNVLTISLKRFANFTGGKIAKVYTWFVIFFYHCTLNFSLSFRINGESGQDRVTCKSCSTCLSHLVMSDGCGSHCESHSVGPNLWHIKQWDCPQLSSILRIGFLGSRLIGLEPPPSAYVCSWKHGPPVSSEITVLTLSIYF